MNLADLIAALKDADQSRICPIGFGCPHSYRGDYACLAFEPLKDAKVADMLADARSARGATYQGYKGGDYTMDEETVVYLADYGCCGEEIGPVLLAYMLGTHNSEFTRGPSGPSSGTPGCALHDQQER